MTSETGEYVAGPLGADVGDCRKFNNLLARLFGLIFRSDRRACVLRIGEVGVEAFATEMAETRRQATRRQGGGSHHGGGEDRVGGRVG